MDVVYFVKDTEQNEELTYSLRSLKNLPHDKVWFFGGCPKNLRPDHHYRVLQNKQTKYDNVHAMYSEILRSDVSEDFIMFNDDFFVMDKVAEVLPVHRGSLYKYIVTVEDNNGGITPYTRRLRKTVQALEKAGLPTRCYELHLPMVFNKEKLRATLSFHLNGVRSIYGNMYYEGNEIPDCKVFKIGQPLPEGPFFSTSDQTWKYYIGDIIKEKFPEQSKYERSEDAST